jgi:hypothetical protein
MTIFSSLFFLAIGLAAGYRLFPVIGAWRNKLRRRLFKPVLLQRHPRSKKTKE